MPAAAFAPLVWAVAALTFLAMVRWWATKAHERDHGMHHRAG